ncbi:hypothetical protein CAL7716_099800 (plasmid) [Calothrix sp. PCC 7716]|nr:hypothetical protein CAL7716_099800 [Calothrix sp. PCC 7716]
MGTILGLINSASGAKVPTAKTMCDKCDKVVITTDQTASTLEQINQYIQDIQATSSLSQITDTVQFSDIASSNSLNLVVEEVVKLELAQETRETKPDKSQYNLFNPTPRELMRAFNAGRPSKTDTPFTIDAGHYQIEADFFTYTRDVNNKYAIDTRAFQIFIPNLRIGLLNNVDFQIIPQIYNNVRTKPASGNKQTTSGFGDTTVGLRVNFWGNDGGQTAFGMISSIKFPTNQNNLGNNSIEGGITFPFAIQLSKNFNLGMQTAFNFNKNDANPGYNLGFVNSVVVGYQATDKLGTYFELFTDFSTETGSQFVATFDTGLTYLLTENLQLDAGVNIGITQAADDFNPFVGLTMRF